MFGVITLSVLIIMIVATIVGAVVGIVLSDVLGFGLYLSIVSGLMATVAAGFSRPGLVYRKLGSRAPASAMLPNIVLVFAGVASLAGSLAAHDVIHLLNVTTPAGLGALAGFLSAILMSLLMITYHLNVKRLAR